MPGPAWLALLGWAALLVLGVVGGALLEARGFSLLVGAPPFMGTYDLRGSSGLALAAGVGALLLLCAMRAARLLPWPGVLAASGLAGGAWAVALALVDGVDALTRPLGSPWEYLADVPRAGDLATLFARFDAGIVRAEDGSSWTTHVAGHPPGAFAVFVLLDRLGLSGAAWASAACIVAGAGAVPAVLVTTRRVVDEPVARAAAPFVTLAPMALWVATSADALFAGVAAWGVASLAVAGSARGSGRAWAALAGGLLLGCCLFLSYGLVLIAPLALAVLVAAGGRRREATVAAGAAAAVLAAGAAMGFWWLHGLSLTVARLDQGYAPHRPGWYFALANLGILGVLVGPAVVAALPLVRGRLTVPVAAIGLAVTLATASGLSKGEVERIWLPFAVWLPVAAATWSHRLGRLGPAQWLAVQVVTTLALAAILRSPW